MVAPVYQHIGYYTGSKLVEDMYDLVLKGGTVIDPSAGLDGRQDIAVQGGVIARIALDIASTEATRTVDVTGKTVTPGIIDLHAHVFEGVNSTGVNPDLGGVYAGVTTIIDAGSAGAATFGAFPRHVIPNCHTEVVPFLHICQTVLDANGKLVPEAREAADRGVWLDTAHGRMNFSFEVGRRCIDQGLLPHCISTDLIVPGRLNTVHSMTEILTRFLGLGFTLPQVVTMCTSNPAKAIGVADRLGTLAVGRQADVSVLEIREGQWVVHDVLGAGLPVTKAVVPFLTVKRGTVFTPDWGPRPWGWEPDRILPAAPIAGGCCD